MTEGVQIPISIESAGAQQANTSMDGLLRVLLKISGSVDTLVGKMDNFGKATKRSMDEAGKSTESLVDKLGKIGWAIQGVKGSVDAVMSVITPIFEEGMGRENAELIFGKLLGSPDEGKAYAEKLRTSTIAAFYGGGTINSAAQQMIAFGVDSGETFDVLNAIGDIAMGDANKLNSLSLAFAQMSSLGKLQTQDWKQMIGQGFNPLNEIMKKTGETSEQLQERMSKGNITAKEVKEAFISAATTGDFAGILEGKMDGLEGKINELKANWADLFKELYDALKPVAESILPKLAKVVQFVTDTLKGQHPVVAMLATVLAAAGAAAYAYSGYLKLATMWTTIMTAKQWLLDAAMAANPVGLVVAGIAALIALITVAIVKYDEWGAALTLIMGPFGQILNIVMALRRNWDSIVTAFKTDGIISGLKRIGQVLLSAIILPIEQLFRNLGLTKWADGLRGLRVALGDEGTKNLADNGMGTEPGKGKGPKGKSGTGTGTGSTERGIKAATAGGTRNTSININLGSLVHEIKYTQSLEKNIQDTTADLQQALLRVLNAAASTGGL